MAVHAASYAVHMKYLCRSIVVFTYALHRTETEDFALTTNH